MAEVTWKPRSKGGWYYSECGRFSIMYDPCRPVKRGRWVLFDKGRTYSFDPGVNPTYADSAARTCKRIAAKWAKQYPIPTAA